MSYVCRRCDHIDGAPYRAPPIERLFVMRRPSVLVLALSLAMASVVAWSADFKKGWDAYNSLDYGTAKSEWEPLAEAGDAKAAYGMGLLYGNGFGVDMNDELALKYYGIAAQKGHADAAFNLAVMHQNGWGVPASDEVANKWYRTAAEKGNTEAQMALGRYYAMDFLDTYDPVQAFKWFNLAEKLGDYGASEKREFMATRMTPEQIKAAQSLVEEWIAANEALLDKN
jgi:TPR repeat protein